MIALLSCLPALLGNNRSALSCCAGVPGTGYRDLSAIFAPQQLIVFLVMTAGDDGRTSSKNENGDVGSDEGGNRRFSFSQLSSGEHHGTGDDVNPPPSPPPQQQQQQEVVEEAEAEQVHPLHLDPPVTSAPSARGSHQQKQQDPLQRPSASASGAATTIRTAAKSGAS